MFGVDARLFTAQRAGMAADNFARPSAVLPFFFEAVCVVALGDDASLFTRTHRALWSGGDLGARASGNTVRLPAGRPFLPFRSCGRQRLLVDQDRTEAVFSTKDFRAIIGREIVEAGSFSSEFSQREQ